MSRNDSPSISKSSRTPLSSKSRRKVRESESIGVGESPLKVIDLLLQRFQEIDELLLEKIKDSSNSFENEVECSQFFKT